MSVTRKPVPKTIASAGCSTPSAVDDAGRRDPLDRVRHQLGVRLLQRREVLVAHQDPLAADLVARRQLLAQRRVGDLLLQVPARHPLGHLAEAVELERQHEALAAPVDRAAHGLLHGGQRAEQRAARAGGPGGPGGAGSTAACAGRGSACRRAAGSAGRPGRRRRRCRSRPRACPSGRRHGASGRCGRPGPRSSRRRGSTG